MGNMTKPKLPLIDLFAGCGGLSLGLEQVGFTPVFVNELHPDARATYLANRKDSPVHRKDRQSADILEITGNPERLKELSSALKKEFGEISLVTGGPPCQGYSARGIRVTFAELQRQDMPSNHLYREMAKFIAAVGPRAFVFENVYGLINAKWTKDGAQGEIWNEVLSTFERIETRIGKKSIGYRVNHFVVKAKQFGVAQNRPRVLIIGIREDIVFSNSTNSLRDLVAPRMFGQAPDLVDLLGDLVDPDWVNGGKSEIYVKNAQNEIQEYLRTKPSGGVSRKGELLLEQEYSKHNETVLARYQAMLDNGGLIPDELKTLKFGQKLLPPRWGDGGPTITATSAPDDYVHFAQPRILSVREWARLQMFPDSYVFCGKRTTGGRRRAGDPSKGIWDRELPKYTQIGNAVPVFLARGIGLAIKDVIS